MSFPLPASGSRARAALGDLSHVAEVLNPANSSRLELLPHAVASARSTIEGSPAAQSVNVICFDPSGDRRLLVSVDREGGFEILWNFGDGRP